MIKKVIYFGLIITIIIIIAYFNQDRTKIYININEIPSLKIKYFYSKNSELIKIQTPKQIIKYELDEFGRRVTKKVNSKIIEKYVWLESNKLLAIADEFNNIKQLYEYKNQNDLLPFAMTQNGKKYYFIYNKMKSLKVVVDEKQNIIRILKYDENGNIKYDSKPSLKVVIGYAGGIYDEHSSLLHFKEGIYNPKISKWLTKIKDHDIIKNLKELNQTKSNDVYKCSSTLDVYYHSYLCANQQCGGLYANDYLNYFNGSGEIVDNSNYFSNSICTKIEPLYKNSDKEIFVSCVSQKIQPRTAKLFDAFKYNCHDEVKNIIKTCSQTAQKQENQGIL